MNKIRVVYRPLHFSDQNLSWLVLWQHPEGGPINWSAYKTWQEAMDWAEMLYTPAVPSVPNIEVSVDNDFLGRYVDVNIRVPRKVIIGLDADEFQQLLIKALTRSNLNEMERDRSYISWSNS
jgi:hypothetical protein